MLNAKQKLKIRYFSDLHLEFINPNKMDHFIKKIQPVMSDEICILAGDIGNPYQSNYNIFMEFMNTHFRRTFVIAGNHEYYNKSKSMDETNAHLAIFFTQFQNIRFLNNSCEYYEDHCFIGTTLWSKITSPTYEINDVYNIPSFDYIQYNRLNMLSVDFLEDSLDKNTNCIVMTHHMPSMSLIDRKYLIPKMLPYNQWFYCDLDDLIKTKKDKIKCWIYGHTHTPASNLIHDVLFLCNPIGYPNENIDSNFQTNISL